MSNINKAAVLNPFSDLTANILNYIPRATTSEFGIVAIGSGINVDSFGRISLDTQEYSNRLTAIETTAASTLETTVNTLEAKADELAASITQKLGTPNGIATLDSAGSIPSSQLPSYVDDILEYENVAAFPATGETGKIYVETAGNTTYRWSGATYTKITSGEVSSVAGKKGIVTLTKDDVGLSNVDNTNDLSKPLSTATQTALTALENKGKRGIINLYDTSLIYGLNERVVLTNGDSVKSTIDGNVNDPNVDMTGWVFDSGFDSLTQFQINQITETLRNFKADPTGVVSSQLSVLDYLKKLPLNPSPTHTPKGYANGGVLNISRGRYVITEPIKLKRGTRICGESSESTQIISRSLTGVFVYEDDGGYVPDEIIAENISVWQDPAYPATSGAAFQVKEGEYTSAVMFVLRNVLIEGAYKGIEAISGIGCSLDNVRVLKTVSDGIDINNKGNSALSTTSTTLKNTYTFLCGGSGINVVGSSYLSIIGGGSDSNVGNGYRIVGANAINLSGVGAERNTGGNFYLKDVTSGNLSAHSITQAGLFHGITLNNVSGLTLLGTNLLADAGNTGDAIHFEASAKRVLILGGTTQNFANKSNNLNNTIFINGQDGTGVIRGGDTNNWTFGSVISTDKTSQVAIAGNAESTTRYGLKISPTFTVVDSNYNGAAFSQFISASAASSTNYNLVVANYIENAFMGANTTVTRTAGQYIKEQTRGNTANANLMIDGGQGTVPAGNWSIYSGSTRTSYFGGTIQSAASLGLFGTTPPATKRSITGKKIPTTIAEQNIVIDSIVSALVAYGFVSDDRT